MLLTGEALAMERTWQAFLLGLAMTGASYGLVCDSNELSERELLRLLACAARMSSASAHRAIVFPGGGCRRECVAKLYADVSDRQRLSVAGKPDCLGGLDLDAFKAEGIAAILVAELREQKIPNTARVVVHGFGSLGQAVCRRLSQEGMTLAGVSDHSGALYRADGLIVSDIAAHYRREPMLFGYSEADHVSRSELLQSTCDVLVITDGTNEIQQRTCGTITANLVLEAHWSAVTASARQHLEERGTKVVPWMLSTSGALLGACFETTEIHA